VALVLLAVHIGGVLVDRFVPLHPLDVLLPMHARFRPVAVAFGIAAMYLAVVVLVSSWTRRRIGTTWWRRLHLLAVPAFTLSVLHGIFTGTDTVRSPMWWLYLSTADLVLFLVVVRALTAGLRPARAAHPIATPVRRAG
jgi:DMSO/TMAO reductase YedYZ heme-binding membrane subunit